MGKYTFENWLCGKVEYEFSKNGLFSPAARKKIHSKSKDILLAEAESRFIKEKDRIEKSLLSVPSREKFIQSEIDIIYRILHKDIDYRNDCKKGGLNADVVYYKTGRFEYDIKQIESIRHNYRIYLQGEINYIGRTPEIDYYKAENIIEAIKFYKLDEWLKELRDNMRGNDTELIHSLLVFKRDSANEIMIDRILNKCKDRLAGSDFNKESYATLYLIIFKNYRNSFKSNIKFITVHKEFDKYFKQQTINFKQNAVEKKAEKLKILNPWIDKL